MKGENKMLPAWLFLMLFLVVARFLLIFLQRTKRWAEHATEEWDNLYAAKGIKRIKEMRLKNNQLTKQRTAGTAEWKMLEHITTGQWKWCTNFCKFLSTPAIVLPFSFSPPVNCFLGLNIWFLFASSFWVGWLSSSLSWISDVCLTRSLTFTPTTLQYVC